MFIRQRTLIPNVFIHLVNKCVVGPWSQVLMIQKPVVRVTHRGTLRGRVGTRGHQQRNKAEVPDAADPECGPGWRWGLLCQWNKRTLLGWMSNSRRAWGSRGALPGASESSCGRIRCGATRNATPTPGNWSGYCCCQSPGEDGVLGEVEPGQGLAKQAES